MLCFMREIWTGKYIVISVPPVVNPQRESYTDWFLKLLPERVIIEIRLECSCR